jgi:hypothetical protein
LHRHGAVSKPIEDHRSSEVIVERYKCLSCQSTFRHYPSGLTAKNQSQRTVVLAALMYGLGLSCSAAPHLLGALGALGALGVGGSKMGVWRDAQEAGEALRESRPAGRARIVAADETVFKVKGEEVVVGFVVDGTSGKTSGFEVLFEGDGRAFRDWLEPYAEELGAEVLASDDNGSYSVAAAELGLSHQLCVAHVRKYVANRADSILERAEKEWDGHDEKLELGKLGGDLRELREHFKTVCYGVRAASRKEEISGWYGPFCATRSPAPILRLRVLKCSLKRLLGELPEEGGERIGWLHRGCLWAAPPTRKGRRTKGATAAYRMKMLTLKLWNDWNKIRLHLARPELKLEGTNNASERSIGKSKVRYKSMRGYKSMGG